MEALTGCSEKYALARPEPFFNPRVACYEMFPIMTIHISYYNYDYVFPIILKCKHSVIR